MTRRALKILSAITLLSFLAPTGALLMPKRALAAPNPNRELREERADDRRQCQAEAGGGLAGMEPDSLAEDLAENIGERIPDVVKDAVENRAPDLIQENLARQMPSLIVDGLKRELPAELARQLRDATDSNGNPLTGQALEREFPRIFRVSINAVLPQVVDDGLRDRLPGIVDVSMQTAITDALHLGLAGVASSTILGFRPDIVAQVAQIFQLVIQEFSNLQATFEGLQQSLEALKSAFGSGDFLGIFTTLAQITQQLEQIGEQIKNIVALINLSSGANQQQLTDDIINNLTQALEQALSDRELDNLSDDLSSNISGFIQGAFDDQVVGQLNGLLEEPLSEVFENDFTGISAQIFDEFSGSFDDLFGDLTQPIRTEINRLTGALTAPLENAFRSFESEIAGTIQDVADTALAPVRNAISQVTEVIAQPIRGLTNSITASLENPLPVNGVTAPDFVGPPAPGEFEAVPDALGPLAPDAPVADSIAGVADDAAGAVADNAEGAVSGALESQLGQSGLGGQLASGLTNAIAGGIGGLFAGVPIVGGALSNLVTNAVNQALGGAAAGALAVPVSEIGALLGTSQSILSTEQSTDKTVGEIKKTQDDIKKTIDEIKALQIEACTHLKVVRRIQEAMESKELVYDKAARDASAQALNKTLNAYVKNIILEGRAENETGVVGADPNQDGGKTYVENIDEHLEEVKKETDKVLVDDLEKLDEETHPYAKIFSQQLKDAEGKDALDEKFKRTISQEEEEKLVDPQSDLNSSDRLKLLTEAASPQNSIYFQYMEFLGELNKRRSRAEENAREEIAIGEGFLSIRICADENEGGGWTNEENGKKVCRKWKTITPSSVVSNTLSALVKAVIDVTTSADEGTEDSYKATLEKLLQGIQNLPKQPDIAKESPAEEDKPICDTPACQDGDWRGGQRTEVEFEIDLGPEPRY